MMSQRLLLRERRIDLGIDMCCDFLTKGYVGGLEVERILYKACLLVDLRFSDTWRL